MPSVAALEAFDRYLVARGLTLDAVVVGRTALNLLVITARVTLDCDVLHPVLPAATVEAARAFAAEWRAAGRQLRDDWLKDGPASLARQLPAGWQDQVSVAFHGAGLVLRTAGRADLLRSKLSRCATAASILADCFAPLRVPTSFATSSRGSSSSTRRPTLTGPSTSGRRWPTWPKGSAMPYSRPRRPAALPTGDDLTRCLAGIGIAVAAEPIRDADIETTLVAASIAGMEHDDLRVLALLVTWFDIHSARVNADRLTRLAAAQSPRVRAFWAALAHGKRRDRRFVRLARHRGRRVDLLATGTDFQIARRGEDPRFAETCLRVPAGSLRDRPGDVLDSAALARHHRPYYWRFIIGPTYRADIWAALERTPTATAYALAAATGASYATAWETRGDYLIGSSAGSAA